MKCLFSSKIMLLGLLALAPALYAAASSANPDSYYQILVRADGLVCHQCATGIAKACKVIHLGQGVGLDLERGLAKVKLSPKEEVPSPAKLEQMITGAGFTFKWAKVTLDGQLSRQKDGYAVSFPKSGQQLTVAVPDDLGAQLARRKTFGRVQVMLIARGADAQRWTLAGVSSAGAESR